MATDGYDILIWVDEDGDVVCRAENYVGYRALRKLYSKYALGDVLQILCAPDQFRQIMPVECRIGIYNPKTEKKTPWLGTGLH